MRPIVRQIARPIVCLIALLLLSCEGPHPSTEATQKFADALTYGDQQALFAVHVNGTDQSEWCRQEFKNLLSKAKDEVRSEDCQRVRSLSEEDLGKMPDELRLAVQVSGWTCEHPKGTCVDYSRTVFEQAAAAHPLVKQKPKSIAVRKVMGDEATATAYLDVTPATGEVEHITLRLKHVGVGWRVAQGFFTP